MFHVRQSFPRPRVEDPPGAVRAGLARICPSVAKGAEIGITVGSRGIRGVAGMTRAAVDFFKALGAKPFIIPAMGSHGGATAEAQAALVAHYGVTEASMGCPIRAAMETRSLGKTPEKVEVFIAETAWQADGVLLMNRVKPHTDFKGPLESGLAKICAIGLGKLDGATHYHTHIFDMGLGAAIRSAAERIVSTGKIIGGIAILENAYHETARVAGVTADGFFRQEEALLDEARGLMGRLPIEEIDVLFCDRMGKNISGAGLDTNIIGRTVYGYLQGKPWQEGMPRVCRIAVSDLTEESDGNAVGMGMVEFITERFHRKIDYHVTTLNAVAASSPLGARTPVVLPNDREVLTSAIATSKRRRNGPHVAYIRDTLELENVYLSEACLPLVSGKDGLEVLSEPTSLAFDDEGYLVSPFAR